MRPTGFTELPLHWGKAPKWLVDKMKKLSYQVAYLIIEDQGRRGFLEKLSDPFWFQAFGCLLGFDWHSSGLTTVTTGVLRSALSKGDLGVMVAGGKAMAKKTPEQIEEIANSFNISSSKLEEWVRASRLTAKVDSVAIQAGYGLYHHAFIATEDGDWAVIQQGMNPENRLARRYHWVSFKIRDMVNEPHSGIVGYKSNKPVLNMVARESEGARRASVDIARDISALTALKRLQLRVKPIDSWTGKVSREWVVIEGFRMPMDVNWAKLKALYEYQPKNYEELLLFKGVGAKTIRALALASELIYGEEPSWRDPVKYSFAHGGKDGVPYPVDRRTYERTISYLREVIEALELGSEDKKLILKRLSKLFSLS